ncbi:TOBE domain-containing protein [Hymenobacter weizhouensis]|uniref:TOBE domain-containing protein n=1 Tax=Hymenobacter sp. YIM 151500-1 TaxID=2987689 RepID=UPI0039B70041
MGHKTVLKAVVREVSERLGITCLLISHDPLDTLSWADHLLVLRQGRVVQQGPPRQLYQQPTDEYVAGLLGSYVVLTEALAPRLSRPASRARRGAKLLVRPESFSLGPAAAGLPGTVQQVRFFGAYCEADVQLAGGTITARTSSADAPAPGAAVGVSLAAGAGWYVA